MFKSKTSTKLVLAVAEQDILTVNAHGDIVIGNARIVIADPVSPSHVATKSYVDSVARGIEPRAACRVYADSNIDITNPPLQIDGVNIAQNDRILLNGQTVATQNGIYVLSGSILRRAADANTSEDFARAIHTYVTDGSVYAKTGWICITTDVNLDTTGIVFSPFSEPSTLLTGDALKFTGNVLDLEDLWSDVPGTIDGVYNVIQIDKYGRVVGVSVADMMTEVVPGIGIVVSNGNEVGLEDIWTDSIPDIENNTYNMVQVDKYGRVTGAALVDLTNPLAPSYDTPATGTAIDITKNIALLGHGTYTLADGVEGQILHIAATYNDSTDPSIVVAHARDGNNSAPMQSNYNWKPFGFKSVTVVIFTNGAWSV
jgi:hypothetical protein